MTDLVEHGRLQGALRIPNTVGSLNITADLRARLVVCSVDVDAPREGRPTTKVNWLVRQLKRANDRARLECNVMNQRGNGASDLLGRVRENPDLLILDPAKTIRSFTVALNSPMGLKSGRGQGTFIDGLLGSIDTFYAEVLQSLKAWAAKPPRMQEQTDATELAKDQEVSPALVARPSRPRTVRPSRRLILYHPAAPSQAAALADHRFCCIKQAHCHRSQYASGKHKSERSTVVDARAKTIIGFHGQERVAHTDARSGDSEACRHGPRSTTSPVVRYDSARMRWAPVPLVVGIFPATPRLHRSSR